MHSLHLWGGDRASPQALSRCCASQRMMGARAAASSCGSRLATPHMRPLSPPHHTSSLSSLPCAHNGPCPCIPSYNHTPAYQHIRYANSDAHDIGHFSSAARPSNPPLRVFTGLPISGPRLRGSRSGAADALSPTLTLTLTLTLTPSLTPSLTLTLTQSRALTQVLLMLSGMGCRRLRTHSSRPGEATAHWGV